MAHQGKILKRLIDKLDLKQVEAANLLNLSRSGLNGLFDKETLAEKHISKAVEKLGVSREIFFPNEPDLSSKSAADVACWQQLAEARLEIIDLQRQIIRMTQPNINAPKKKEAV
ncbi:hypothetical protein GCM10023185_38110 [Hymenobacter saemangeumensis]|uniref:XRE family transcriptional regulator n=1 Tax=Hymenobacter saemangeumensis TaxID=1084522 RepID=A0ABP8IQX2_9BACT